MFRIRVLLCCVLMAAFASLPAIAKLSARDLGTFENVALLQVDGQLTIDPQGVPSEYKIGTSVSKTLGDSLQQHVMKWRFEPVVINGAPVSARTQIRITLLAKPEGNDYAVTVDNVTFPEGSDDAKDPGNSDRPVTISFDRKPYASYPPTALSYGVSANALVLARISPDGRVEQTFVEQIALLNVKGKQEDLAYMAGLFARQVLGDSNRWRFHVVADQARIDAMRQADPDAIATAFTVRIPVWYRIAGSPADQAGHWQHVARSALRSASWLSSRPEDPVIGVADLNAGELAPVNNGPFRLNTQVKGTAL